ncbi:hypothetical protein MKEN_00122800 [Mycena kentingensis (nom. inval.)]|nr:hypothetical protein MKEN_00122800 [Mycena kentingensis (nom. inval.)]
MRIPEPSLSYPITRPYPPSLALLAYSVAAVFLPLLVIVNVALIGYETVSVFDGDFNKTQNFWYDRFLPTFARSEGSTPGNLCTERLLRLGDTVTTNYALFQYSIASIDRANVNGGDETGLSYKGWTLDECDVTALYVNVVGQTLSADFTALVACNSSREGVNFTMRADWTQSSLVGKYTSILGVQKAAANSNATVSEHKARGMALSALVTAAGTDWVWGIQVLDLTNFTSPEVISFAAQFPYCPPSASAGCATPDPPSLNIASTTEITGAGSQEKISTYVASKPSGGFNIPLLDLNNDTYGLAHVASNTVQSLWAALRLDLGIHSANNFLLNTSVIPRAIASSFPAPSSLSPTAILQLQNESYLYSVLVGDGYYARMQNDSSFDGIPALLPLTAPGPAVLDSVYLCQIQQMKSAGSVFVGVVAGTYTMFMTAWQILVFVLAFWWKRKRGENWEPVAGKSESEKLLRRPSQNEPNNVQDPVVESTPSAPGPRGSGSNNPDTNLEATQTVSISKLAGRRPTSHRTTTV